MENWDIQAKEVIESTLEFAKWDSVKKEVSIEHEDEKHTFSSLEKLIEFLDKIGQSKALSHMPSGKDNEKLRNEYLEYEDVVNEIFKSDKYFSELKALNWHLKLY